MCQQTSSSGLAAPLVARGRTGAIPPPAWANPGRFIRDGAAVRTQQRQAPPMAIAIAGMHRSGTSMVAQFLHRSGVYLGPDAILMPAANENPDGFWEHLQVVEINDELLSLLGGGWDYPPAAPIVPNDPRLDTLRNRARRVFADFAAHQRWGWKDPRTSLTLPFWREVVDDLRVVAVVRNPLEVAHSLRKRNGFSLALGLALWQGTYAAMLNDTTPGERIFTHYDAYFGRPGEEFGRVLRFLGLPDDEAAIADLMHTARSPALRHHRLTARDLIEADVNDAVLDLYRLLCQEADWIDEGFAEDMTEDGDASDAGTVPYDTANPVPWSYYAETDLLPGIGQGNRALIELAKTRWDLSEHKRSAINRQARLDELEGGIVERDSKLQERDMRIGHLIGALRQRDATLAQLTRERDQLAAALAATSAGDATSDAGA